MTIWLSFFVSLSLSIIYSRYISILLHRSLQLESDLISLYVFPLFSVAEKDCKQCSTVLQELENIDDEAEDAGNFFGLLETYCYLHSNCISIRMYLHTVSEYECHTLSKEHNGNEVYWTEQNLA